MRELINQGSLGPFFCDGREIVRRIFVTVRDRNWQEVAPTVWDAQIDAARSSVTLSARHQSDLVDFEWRGSLQLSADHRSLRFWFEGTVRRDMEVCRLGLIVLHPPEVMIGAHVDARSGSSAQSLVVPEQISPQPIIDGVPGALTEPFSELKIARADLGVLGLRFEGDLFELEDQRNWGDASFKSYCTPLRLGYPREVREGTKIQHGVELQFAPASKDGTNSQSSSTSRASTQRPGKFPRIGLQWRDGLSARSGDDSMSSFAQHYFVDATREAGADALRSLLKSTPRAKIELAVDATADGAVETRQLELVRDHAASIERLLVYGIGADLPSRSALERWRQATLDANIAAPLVAATRGYYVEYNRRAPLGASIDGIAFPLTATVHSDEAGTILENVPTIEDMADTARQLVSPREIIIAPLALYYPRTPNAANFPPSLALPWLAATTLHAALGGVTSVTLASDLIDTVLKAGPSAAGFLKELTQLAGHGVASVGASLPLGVHGMMFQASGQPTKLLVANLTTQVQQTSIPGSALRCRNAVTAEELPVSGAKVDIPSRSVVWIDLDPATGAERT